MAIIKEILKIEPQIKELKFFLRNSDKLVKDAIVRRKDMMVNLPLMNTGVTPFTNMSNLRTGEIAGKSRVLATNIKQSSNVIQSMVRGALSKAVESARRIDLKA